MSSTHLPKKPVAVVDEDDEELQVEELGSAPKHAPYEYQSLPQGDYFRVLELLPGQGNCSLRGNIAQYSLDAWNRPPYKTLSYTWGESKYDHLVIAGQRVAMDSDLRQRYAVRHPLYFDDRRLLISTNLRDALRALRHPTLPVLLWVDAVCINQQDDAERSSQIMLMPRIHHRCLRVLVWLGEADSDTRPAFDAVRWLAPQYDRYIEGKERRLHPGPETLHDEAFLLRSGLPPFSSGAYGPFMRLLDRPVFRRIWCVQEVAFHWNVVVVCGSQKSRVPEVAYADIAKACSFLRLAGWNGELQTAYVSGRDVLFFPTAVIGTQSNWFGKRVDRSLLVYEMRSFEVTDPRDKIFAMLGLLNDHSHRQLHELGVPSNDKCQNGHAISCPHFRIEIMNWAETK